MGRLGLAAFAAIVLHALIFNMDGRWLKRDIKLGPVTESIAITINYVTPHRNSPPPEDKQETVQKRPIPAKKVAKKPSPKQPPKKTIKKKVPVKRPKLSKMIKSPVKKPDPPPPRPREAIKPEIVPVQKDQHEPDLIFSEDDLEVDDEAMRLSSVPVGLKEQKPPQTAHLPLKLAVPMYKKNPAPKYPRVARRKGYQGTVVIEVLVNREGRVKDARLLQSSGHSILDKAALGSVKTWIFDPAMKGEEPVEMWVKVPVRFQLE